MVSASDFIALRCESWKTRSKRLTINGIVDEDPVLTYKVLQYTEGAFIEEELITQRGILPYISFILLYELKSI